MAKILIVDDELSFRLLLQATLPLLGYEVAGVAAGGAEALELARFLKPDLVLMDIVMPGALDGIEAAKKIRAELAIPVIFLTGHGDDEIVARAKCADPFAFLIKPCGEEELKAAIELALHLGSRERRVNDMLSSYREFTEAVPLTFWLRTADYGRILYVSPSYEKMWGRSREALFMDPLDHLEAVHPDELSYVLEKIERQKAGEITEKVFRIVRPDGSIRWLRDCAFPIKDDRGAGFRITGISEDITEQVRREQALQASEERYRRIVETGEEGIWLVDREWKTSFVNARMEQMLGCRPGEMLGRHLLEFMGEDGVLRAQDLMTRREKGVRESHQFQFLRRDGTELWALVAANPFLDDAGAFAGALAMVFDITERKRAEEALRVSEERLRLAHKATNDVIWDWDVVKDAQYWNDAGGVVFGWTDIVERPQTAAWWTDRVHPEDWQRVHDGFFAVVNESGVDHWHDEYRFRKADGTYAEVIDRGYVMRDEQGKAIRMIGAMLDITERKQAEAALRVSEERFRTVADFTYDWEYWMGPDMTFLYCSPSCERIAGYRAEEFEKDPDLLSTIIHPDDRDRFLLHMKVGEGRDSESQELEFRILTRSGEVRWLAHACQTVRDQDGACLGCRASNRDITDRKRAEEALRESVERYRMIFDHSPLGVMHFDSKGIIRDVNDKFAEIIGARREDILGFEMLTRLRDPAMLQAVKDALEGRLGHYEGDYRSITGGKLTPLRAVFQRITDEDEKTLGAVGLFEDVTERKRAEGERKKLETYLRQAQKMEAIGTLAGGIAHDFNNVLSAIFGFTELSLGKAPPDSPIQADLQQVLLAAERAKDLVRQILTFSRQSKQEIKPVRVVPLLKEALKFLRASIPSTIAIRRHLGTSSESTVLADPTQIHQVIMNLCTNAAYAMREHGGTLEVELFEVFLSKIDDPIPYLGLAPGRYLCLRVSDTGCGMDEETIQRVFDPFFTTKPREEGTGMGLAVVYGIVQACGGGITVRSKPGEGSHFHLYFQMAPPLTPERISDQKEVPRGKGRILFVDDETALVRLGEKTLQGFGYTVVAESSSRKALAIFRARPEEFDLLITDYTMPQMTGLDLVKQIREIRADLPVILCSGYTDFLDSISISDLGVQELIHKPINRRAMAEAISRILPQK